jgi:hypothetical protein
MACVAYSHIKQNAAQETRLLEWEFSYAILKITQ